MEVNEEKEQEKLEEPRQNITIVSTKKNRKLIILLIGIIIVLVLVFVIPSKEGKIISSVKTSLDKIVEKSDLETAKFTYNVIAKKCKDIENCDLKSNNIDDFEYVVSCKGTLTAGIDFEKIEVDVDKKNKKVIVTIPEATIKGVNIEPSKYINGNEILATELPNAIQLCEDTTLARSEKDGKLLPAAKEQARVVLQSFYERWIKSYDKDYKVEVK